MTTVEGPVRQDNLTLDEARSRASMLSNLAYEVSLTVSDDPAAQTFESTTTVTFDAHEGAETFIDIAARTILDVSLNGKQLADAQHGFDGTRLWLRGLRAGRNRVDITAEFDYRNTGVGLHRLVDPVDRQVYLYTHFEPFDAHKVLACFDQPDLKGKVTVHVNAPVEWTVCSNARVVRSSTADGMKSWHFNTTPPLPPYLIAVVAGRYRIISDKHGAIPLGIWSRESMAEYAQAASGEIFEITKAGLDFFGGYFGLAYPFDEYNQLFVPEFNMGAMENPGCVTFNETYLFRGQASEAQLQRRAETILHEMAHVHGFGDVTTMRWWGDLWLNETFATYMSNLAMQDATQYTNVWVSFANTVKAIAARQDQLVTTHQIADDIPDTISVRQNFDGITYHKGAAVLRQLVAWVGDDAFKRGVQDYFKRYRWGNATLAEFLDCLRRASGRDVTRWAIQWLQTTGMNTLRPRITTQGDVYSSFAVEQTAAPDHPTLRSHRVAIALYDRRTDGRLVRRQRVETDIEGKYTEIPQLSGARIADLVLLNDGDLTFAKIRFDERSLHTMTSALPWVDDPLARALCWAALWDMTRDAELPARQFVELVASHATGETEELVIERVLSQAQMAIDLYGDPANRDAARARLHEAAADQVAHADLPPELRLTWMRTFVTTAAGDDALSRLEAFLAGKEAFKGITADTDMRWLVIGHLAGEGRADAARIIEAAREDPTDIGRRRAASCLAARPVAEAKAEAWARIVEHSAPMPEEWAAVLDRDQSLSTMTTMAAGFNMGATAVGGFMHRGPDPELLRPYVERYVEALPAVWAQRTIDEAEAITELLYPRYLIDHEVVAAIDRALAGDLPATAIRTLREGRDGTIRAQRARRADMAALAQPASSKAVSAASS
jgi:aminopeptidase N